MLPIPRGPCVGIRRATGNRIAIRASGESSGSRHHRQSTSRTHVSHGTPPEASPAETGESHHTHRHPFRESHGTEITTDTGLRVGLTQCNRFILHYPRHEHSFPACRASQRHESNRYHYQALSRHRHAAQGVPRKKRRLGTKNEQISIERFHPLKINSIRETTHESLPQKGGSVKTVSRR